MVSFKNHQRKWAWSQEQSLTKWIRTPGLATNTHLCQCHKQFSDEKGQHFISKCICGDVKLSSCALHSGCVFKTIVPNLNCSKRQCTLYNVHTFDSSSHNHCNPIRSFRKIETKSFATLKSPKINCWSILLLNTARIGPIELLGQKGGGGGRVSLSLELG